MNEVQLDSVNIHFEVGKRVQGCLSLSPVERILPIIRKLLRMMQIVAKI